MQQVSAALLLLSTSSHLAGGSPHFCSEPAGVSPAAEGPRSSLPLPLRRGVKRKPDSQRRNGDEGEARSSAPQIPGSTRSLAAELLIPGPTRAQIPGKGGKQRHRRLGAWRPKQAGEIGGPTTPAARGDHEARAPSARPKHSLIRQIQPQETVSPIA